MHLSQETRAPVWARQCGLIALVLLVVGCGSRGTHSAREVERVFLAAGVPFQSEHLPNAALRPADAVIGLPGPPEAQKAAVAHLQAVLVSSNNRAFSAQIAYVFDSTKSADQARRTFPLSKWMTSNKPVIRTQIANVIIVAAPAGNSNQARRIRRAIAALQAG
jgi:hypothetical protein